MRVAIIDFETTGTDTSKDRITEAGMQITTDDFRAVMLEFNRVCYAPDYPVLTPEVERLTGITNDFLKKEGIEPRTALLQMAQECKDHNIGLAVAYNAKFDRSVFEAEVKRLGIENFPEIKYLLNTTWVCAMVDVESNYLKKCWKLSHLALDYGLDVDPRVLHRAVNDVNLTRRLLAYISCTAQKLAAFNATPWIYVKAKVRKPWEDGGESTTLAKAAGYAWQTAKGDSDSRVFEKTWVKKVKTNKYEEELTRPFEVCQIV